MEDDIFKIKIKSFDLNPCALMIFDAAQRILSANKSALKMFGYSEDELTLQHLETLLPENSRAIHSEHAANYLKNPEKREMGKGRDLFGRKKNGDVFPIEIGLSPFIENGQTYISISVIDITYRKKLEKNLSDKNNLLNEINKKLNSFANVTAHDLKSPLRTISGFSDLLLGKLSKTLDSDSIDFLTRIKASANRLSGLIETLLEFSVDIKEIKMEEVDLNLVIKNVLSDIAGVIDKTNTRLKIESLPTVKGNETQLYQVFLNIISNAIKYSRKDIEPAIYIRGGTLDEKFFIEVKDNGIGFDQKHAELIFEPFERLVRYDEYEGFGIGLATVKKIILNHKGVIEAKSSVGEGSVFTIFLPCF